MEMMHHEAGVRAVVVGGQPQYGPMQTPSGSRGALYYTSDELDDNIDFAVNNSDAAAASLPNRQNDIYITNLGINLRDQVRRGGNVPLQFVYEAADCRIFFTPQTIYNYTNLWQYAADAIWVNSSLCIENSTGYATYNTTDTKGPPPSATTQNTQVPDLSRYLDLNGDIQALAIDVSSGLPDKAIPIKSSIGTQQISLLFDKKIPDKFRVRKGKFKGACTNGSPRCGGTKTGQFNPQNTLPPKTQPSPAPAPSPEPAPIPEPAPSPEGGMAEMIESGFDGSG